MRDHRLAFSGLIPSGVVCGSHASLERMGKRIGGLGS
jgi:hypothetical protein